MNHHALNIKALKHIKESPIFIQGDIDRIISIIGDAPLSVYGIISKCIFEDN